jgi:lysozyme family protein
MPDFTTALNYALKHEREWVNCPYDPGRPTMLGVTLGAAKRGTAFKARRS